MAYSRDYWTKKGTATQYTKTQVFVANSLGTCEVMVYDTSAYGSAITVSFFFDVDTSVGTLVWSQGHDDGDSTKNARALIKTAHFTVANGAVVGLPLTPTTIYRAATAGGFDDVRLSSDGSRLAFSFDDTVFGGRHARVFVCSMPTCTSLQTAFDATDLNDPTPFGGTLELSLGRSEVDGAERVYFMYRPRPGTALGGDLAMIESQGGIWSSPVVLVNNDQYATDTHVTALRKPSVWSEAGGPDQIAFTSQDGAGSSNPLRVDVYDVGTATLGRNIGTGFGPSWTASPSTDAHAPNILVGNSYPGQTAGILEIDPDGSAESALPIAVGVFGVDSAQ